MQELCCLLPRDAEDEMTGPLRSTRGTVHLHKPRHLVKHMKMYTPWPT
jgi:hypothetical protein